MREDEKRLLVEKKREVTEWLSSLDISSYELGEISVPLEEYCMDVAARPEGHNVYEQLAVKAFFLKIDRYGLSRGEVKRFFYFYEQLYFPGRKGLRRYALTGVQSFQFANVYGFHHPDGRRVVRECCLFVPRKFSKTTGTSAFAIYDLFFGDADAEVYIGANSQMQAKKCFDVIRGAVRKLDPRGKRFVVNETELKPTRKWNRQASARCLTSNARTKDGMNASTVIMDEFSQARDSELLTVLTTSMGVRENPLTVIITTASDLFDGPFYSMLQGYKSILTGELDDDSVFAHIFEPDISDREDDPATWKKVHPHLGVTVQENFYEEEYRKAVRGGAEQMLAFRTKLLNVFTVNERQSWISAEVARGMSRDIRLDNLPGRPDAMVAIDLSERGDFSAVSVGFYDERRHAFGYITDYFFPEGALQGHPNERLYRKWAEEGHLHLLPGPVIDYREIVEHVLRISDVCRVLRIGYDPYKSLEVVNMLAAAGGGGALVAVSQTIGNFNAATESFEHAAYLGKIWINDNPVNHYCFGNAVIMEDSNENRKPEKRTPNGRIDGVITMLMCHRLFIDERR